jgi:hypothetical protein
MSSLSLVEGGEHGLSTSSLFIHIPKCFLPHSAFFSFYTINGGQVLVVHACNPSYSEGRDWEDQGLKQIVHEIVSRKNPSQKRASEWLKE